MNELIKVEDSFVIEGRGVILLPDFPIPQDGWKAREEVVNVQMPDGTSHESKACIDLTHFSLADPNATSDQKYRVVVRLVEEIDNIPAGTRIFASNELCNSLQHD